MPNLFPDIKSPRYPIQELPEYGVLIHRTMDDNKEQRIKTRSKAYKRIRVAWRRLSDDDKILLDNFFDAMDSIRDEFHLQDFWVKGKTYIARFDAQNIEFQYYVNDFWHSQSITFVILGEVV